MAPASDNNNQDLATKKAKLEPNTVIGVGAISEYLPTYCFFLFEIVLIAQLDLATSFIRLHQ